MRFIFREGKLVKKVVGCKLKVTQIGTQCPSPDNSENPFVAAFDTKDCNG
ncbi:MAG: hypothetical protein IPP30_06220 [Flavobacterium sp.]|nr:hypothetical protein [Flavobacterium sp.]